MKSLRVDALGVAFVAVWSSAYVVGKLATDVMPPLTVTLWRFVLAGAVLAIVALILRERWPKGRELGALAIAGVPLFAVQFGGVYSSLAAGMPAGTVSLIVCSSPLLVAAVSAALGWERLGSRRWIGVGLGVVGVIVTLSDRVGRPPSIAALLWVLLGLAALTGGTLLHSRVRTTAGPSTQGVVEVAASAVVMAAWAPPKGSLAIPLTFQGVGSFLWLALIVGAGSPLLLFALIRQRGATRASSLLFIVPAVTAFASWPILGTAVGIVTVAGLVIVGIGLWLARPKMEQPAPTKPAEAEAEEELFPL